MEPVQRKLGEAMDAIPWNDPTTPLVSNASGRARDHGRGGAPGAGRSDRQPRAAGSTASRRCAGDGCDTFLELGPGRVLSGLVRQIDPDVETFPADSPEKLATFKERAGA